MKSITVTLFTVLCCSYVFGEDDVFWTTWKGKVPENAILAGYTESECGTKVPFYLAQAFFSNYMTGVFPSRIFTFSKSVKASHGGKKVESSNLIKVLCAKNPDSVTWVPVSQLNKQEDLEDSCVIAGVESVRRFGDTDDDASPLFFGRARYKDDLVIGKVKEYRSGAYSDRYSSADYYSKRGDDRYMNEEKDMKKPEPSLAIYFPFGAKEKILREDFEVLCYKQALSDSDNETTAKGVGEKNDEV